MKKLLSCRKASLAICLIGLGMVSCRDFKGVDIAKQNDVNELLISKIEKKIGAETPVFRIEMHQYEHFNTWMGAADVTFFDAEQDKVRKWTIQLNADAEPREYGIVNREDTKKKPGNGVKLSDVDVSRISSNIEQGKAMMTEADVKFSGISHYYILLNTDPDKVVHEFQLTSKGETKTATKHGRSVEETSYYKFDFKANADGEVIYTGK